MTRTLLKHALRFGGLLIGMKLIEKSAASKPASSRRASTQARGPYVFPRAEHHPESGGEHGHLTTFQLAAMVVLTSTLLVLAV
jgi:hypothetical protein